MKQKTTHYLLHTNKNNKSKHNEFQQIKISNWIFGMKALIFRTTSEIY